MGRAKRERQSRKYWERKRQDPLYVLPKDCKEFIPLDSIEAFKVLDKELRLQIGVDISRRARTQEVKYSYRRLNDYLVKVYPREWLLTELAK